MPRYRKLHVKTLESLDMNDMPDDFTRLMWVLLPLALCREGRGIHHPAWLKSKLFPLRFDVTEDMVTDSFDWLISRGMIETYRVNERDYFRVPSFHRYQGNTIKEAESDYPPPDDELLTDSRPTPDLLQTNSATDAVCSIQYSDSNADSTTTTNADGASAPVDAVVGRELLLEFGVREPSATNCAASPLGYIEGWIVDARAKGRRLENPQGYVIKQLQSGIPPPTPANDRRRFAQGEYVQS